jgi:chromosome segregation ATPase
MVHVILAVAGCVAVGAAVTYYFVSNDGNAKREELLRKMEAVLDALSKKAEKLKSEKEAAEAFCRAAMTNMEEMRAYCEELKKELAQTLKERDDLAAEVKRWRECEGTVASGIAVIGFSKVLLSANFDHENAIKNLDSRIERIGITTLRLENKGPDTAGATARLI